MNYSKLTLAILSLTLVVSCASHRFAFQKGQRVDEIWGNRVYVQVYTSGGEVAKGAVPQFLRNQTKYWFKKRKFEIETDEPKKASVHVVFTYYPSLSKKTAVNSWKEIGNQENTLAYGYGSGAGSYTNTYSSPMNNYYSPSNPSGYYYSTQHYQTIYGNNFPYTVQQSNHNWNLQLGGNHKTFSPLEIEKELKRDAAEAGLESFFYQVRVYNSGKPPMIIAQGFAQEKKRDPQFFQKKPELYSILRKVFEKSELDEVKVSVAKDPSEFPGCWARLDIEYDTSKKAKKWQ
ncbi:MAG: hypothetical protein KDD25_03365, partial [Bdellovibrionales bacterium]|nr:hypothetical protein [Bdellovibrionales bacterium]